MEEYPFLDLLSITECLPRGRGYTEHLSNIISVFCYDNFTCWVIIPIFDDKM